MIPLEHGLPEALHYMRRPIAELDGGQHPEVLTQFAPATAVISDNPALTDVYLRYDQVVVATFTSGSPMTKYLDDHTSWARFVGTNSIGLLDPPTVLIRDLPAIPGGTLLIDGRPHDALAVPRANGRLTRMCVLRSVAVAVTGSVQAVDEVRLRMAQPNQQLVASVFFGGPYPRYRPGIADAA